VTLSGLALLVPEYVFEEVRRHLPVLRKRSRLSVRDSDRLLERLSGYFTIVSADAVARRLPEATRIMAGIDPTDSAYLAAALAVPCDGIWSDDLHFRRQTAIRSWTTPELVAELTASGMRF